MPRHGRAQAGMGALHRMFDILGIVIDAPHDDDILDASGNKKLALGVHEFEVPGPQPAAVRLASNCGREGSPGFCSLFQ